MTRYEQGFLNKCAEYGVDMDTSVQLLKTAQEYGSGIGDTFREIGDNFRKGGIGRISNRQQSFNRDYGRAGLFKRIGMGILHPNRTARARQAAQLGAFQNNGLSGVPVTKTVQTTT